MTILEKLNIIFRQIFDQPELVVTPATNASQIKEWDSFMHVNLVVAIEEELNVSFSTQEIGSFTCLGDVIQLLKEKGISEPVA